jgi:hypothetical protein
MTATLEQDVADLKDRVEALEKAHDGHRTVFVKLIPIIEETRLRVTHVEDDVAQIKKDLHLVRADLRTLRNDIPSMVGDALREYFKERDKKEEDE